MSRFCHSRMSAPMPPRGARSPYIAAKARTSSRTLRIRGSRRDPCSPSILRQAQDEDRALDRVRSLWGSKKALTPSLSKGEGRLGMFLQTLDDRHIGEAAAFAHRLQAPLLVAVFECIQKCRHQLGAAGAERMAERNGAAIDVQMLRIRAVLLQPGDGNRRERLVDLE